MNAVTLLLVALLGLGGVPHKAWLQRHAQRHVQRIARQGELRHSNLRLRDCRKVAEVVGYGPTPEVLARAYLESPPHRRIIRRSWDYLGAATVRRDGQVWSVIDFCEVR